MPNGKLNVRGLEGLDAQGCLIRRAGHPVVIIIEAAMGAS